MTKHQKNDEQISETQTENDETQTSLPDVEEAETTPEEVSENDSQLLEMQEEIEKLKDLYMRAQAEMENLRRRTKIELEKASKYAISSFAQDILAVNDNLSRAIESVPEDEKQADVIKNLMVGLEMTQKELDTALEKNKITAIESKGLIFDPNVHQVVQEVEDETKPAGTIIQEWQKGYMIDGSRVLREAVVIVTKGGPKTGEKVEHVDTTI